MPSRAAVPDPNRLRIIGLTETCGNCVAKDAEIEQLRAELDRAHAALRRESYRDDPREPHRSRR
jgi:hypothetical protein